MSAKVFLTGASGYIGGETLFQLYESFNQHQIRCLIRDVQKASSIRAAFPGVEIVHGDLDDADLIEKEALNADVVLHLASTRHEVSSRAIVRGLGDDKRSKPGYWLQIGGASMFAGSEIKAGIYGEAGSKTFDDISDIEEIKSVIKASPARVVDNLVINQIPAKVKTALVAGPIIYGAGRGPVNTSSIQGPAIADYTLKHGVSFRIGQGQNVWSTIHVADIGRLFVLLVEAALDNRENLWNEDGFYLPENGRISFADFAHLISKAANDQALIKSVQVRSLSAEEVNSLVPHGAVILGTNAQIHSSRANKYLEWQPNRKSLAEEIPLMVKSRAERLQSAV